MTYNLREWGVDNVAAASAPVTLTDEQIREGVKCGALDLTRINSGLALAFADIKAVHGLDDFLEGLTVTADPATAGRFVIGGNMNEAEDSIDGGFGVCFDGPIVASIAASGDLKISVDFNLLTAAQAAEIMGNVEMKKAMCDFIIKHWKDIAGDLHFANGCDPVTGDPTFAP